MSSYMMRRCMLMTALFLITTGGAFAQPASLTISLTGGYRNAPAYVCQSGPENRLYPEVQVASQLAVVVRQMLSIHGALYYAYWDDGVGKQSDMVCVDSYLYSYSEHTAGARLFVASEGGLPLVVSVGLARRFGFNEYIAGEGWGGGPADDYRSYHTTAEIGLHVRIPIGARLELQGGACRFVRLPPHQHIIGAFIEDALRTYQLGIGYMLF